MNLNTYEAGGRALYARLADAVASILSTAIRLQPGLRLQHIQQRAKETSSLRSKLTRAGALDSEDIATVAKDLAGCRLVFYTNSDAGRFQASGIITDNFVVDWDRTKIHHPHPQASEAAELFISNNYVVRLKDSRVALPEYADLRDIWCELQVQTTLNHAWSEMAHDTIYKVPELQGFGGTLMQSIERRMKKIMRDHLLPAGYEFQKVVDDFERLQSGKELFDQGALIQLAACEDNNARYELLQRFEEYVLPSYDDLTKVQSDLRAAVITAVQQAYTTPKRPIETPFNTLPGYDADAVVDVAANILDYIRYFDVEGTFDAICVLFVGATTERIRKRLLSSAEHLAEHELDIWRQAGPAVQHRLVEHLRRMDRDEMEAAKPIVMKVLAEVLQTELTGSSATYNALTLRSAAATPSEILTSTRRGAINLLKGFFREADSEESKLEIVRTLAVAMQPPLRGLSDDLRKTILRDTADIVAFYNEVAAGQSYELLEHLEHSLLWQYRHKRKPPDEKPDAEMTTLRSKLTERIFAFRDLINADRGFVIYKTLVGFESVFPPEWEGDSLDVAGREAYRNAQIADLVSQVTDDTVDYWYSIIQRCAQTESKDGATFISFGQFLEQLGSSKPHIMLAYLDRVDDRLANFLPGMLAGLEHGEQREALLAKIRQWIAERRYLGPIIWHERFAVKVDADVLDDALSAAIETRDDRAVLKAIAAATARYGDAPGALLRGVFLRALGYLIDKKDTSWVNETALRVNKNTLFKDLAAEQLDLVFASLVQTPEIGYRTEEVLNEIAKHRPTKVVDFFGQRLAHERAETDGDRYEAVPYEFHLLTQTLQNNPTYVVEAARRWFTDDPEHFSYRGGRFLANIFPVFTSEYDQALQELSEGGTRANLEFLVQVLRCYNGQVFTHDLSKTIIDALPPKDPLLNQVGMALDATGAVRGEFGQVEAYRQKKQEVEPWLTDPREKVREFAGHHNYRLEQQIAAEQRRSEEELEFRKRSYPSSDETEE